MIEKQTNKETDKQTKKQLKNEQKKDKNIINIMKKPTKTTTTKNRKI